MSEAAAEMSPVLVEVSTDRLMWATHRDRILPSLAALSLIVHATIFLPSLLRHDEPAATPKEIPVELVQLPPPPKPKPLKPPARKPQSSKSQQSKPDARKPKAPERQVAKAAPKPTAAEKPKVAEKPKAAEKPPAHQQAAQKTGTERLKDLLGPMPALALPSSAADGGDAVSYSQLVLSKLAKAKKDGRYSGVPGATSVSFTIGDSGEITKVEIVRPSGDASLDAEAVAMVRRGAPYPPPPPGGRRDYTITLRFQALT